MNKVEIAYGRIVDILSEGGESDMKTLLWEVNYSLDLDQMVSMATLRKAVALLPAPCVSRQGRRIIVQARHFAPATEVVATLQALPHWCDWLPILIERHKDALQRALLLADRWSLIQSVEWASAGVFTVDYTVYGMSVRWLKSEVAA